MGPGPGPGLLKGLPDLWLSCIILNVLQKKGGTIRIKTQSALNFELDLTIFNL